MSRADERREPEPVTIRDKRRIDPVTGAVRTPAAEPPDTGEVLAEQVLAGEVTGENAPEQAELDPVQAELAERTADLQRVSAEYANYRRRVDRDRQAVIDAAKASVVAGLIGVLDDLERARSHDDLQGPLKSVADKLVDALTAQGLTTFGAVGDAFDPAVHEAVAHEGSGGAPLVSLVMRHGYRFGERVLRPAMVAVSEAESTFGEPTFGEPAPSAAASDAPEQDMAARDAT